MRKRVAILAVTALLAATVAHATERPRSVSQQIAMQAGQFMVPVFDTTYATSSGTSDTLYFGAWCSMVEGEAYTAADSLAWYEDTALPHSLGTSARYQGLSTIPWTSGRSNASVMSWVDTDLWNLPASGSFSYWPVRLSAVVVKGTGTGTIHIRAWTYAPFGVQGP